MREQTGCINHSFVIVIAIIFVIIPHTTEVTAQFSQSTSIVIAIITVTDIVRFCAFIEHIRLGSLQQTLVQHLVSLQSRYSSQTLGEHHTQFLRLRSDAGVETDKSNGHDDESDVSRSDEHSYSHAPPDHTHGGQDTVDCRHGNVLQRIGL
jgi:hypothetical protein